MYEFCLSSKSVERRVIAKVRLPRKAAARGAGSFANVSRLVGPEEHRVRTQYEFTAMSSLMALVDRQPGERFGSVRILEMLAELSALIMEKRPEEDCRRLLALARTGSDSSSAQVLPAMRNTGALLRLFHGLADLPHTKSRGAEVGELIDSLLRLTQYLRERVRQGPFLERISCELVKVLRTSQRDGLSLGLSHGDLLPGNVLAGRHGRVVLLDTFAEWRAPSTKTLVNS